MQRKTLTAFVYLLAAVADSWLLATRGLGYWPLNQPSRFESSLCFLAAVLFALAAGRALRWTHFAHLCAAAGVVALPWVYTTTLHGNIYSNQWILFNVPDRDLGMYGGLTMAKLANIAVVLIVLGIATGIVRLMPRRWVFSLLLGKRTNRKSTFDGS